MASLHRAWYLANRERARETSRQWSHLNRERKAAYQRPRSANLSAAQWTDADVAQVRTLLEGECAYCGANGKLTLDHVIPLARGGSHRLENLVAACKSCNSRKGARDELEFRALLALEALIDGRRRGLGERTAPYRVRGSCRIPRHALLLSATRTSGSGTCKATLTA